MATTREAPARERDVVHVILNQKKQSSTIRANIQTAEVWLPHGEPDGKIGVAFASRVARGTA